MEGARWQVIETLKWQETLGGVPDKKQEEEFAHTGKGQKKIGLY